MSISRGGLGGRLFLQALLVAAVIGAGSTLSAQAIGSNYSNITFAQSWGPIPAGYTQLSDYFVAPGNVTMLELWAPN